MELLFFVLISLFCQNREISCFQQLMSIFHLHRYSHLLIQTTQQTKAMIGTRSFSLKYLMILGQPWFMVCGGVCIYLNFLSNDCSSYIFLLPSPVDVLLYFIYHNYVLLLCCELSLKIYKIVERSNISHTL